MPPSAATRRPRRRHITEPNAGETSGCDPIALGCHPIAFGCHPAQTILVLAAKGTSREEGTCSKPGPPSSRPAFFALAMRDAAHSSITRYQRDGGSCAPRSVACSLGLSMPRWSNRSKPSRESSTRTDAPWSTVRR